MHVVALVRRFLWRSSMLVLGIGAGVTVVLIAAVGLAALSTGRTTVGVAALLGLVALAGLATATLCLPSARR